MCEKDVENLSYTQLSSSINPSFWNKFTELKLDVDKLNEKEHEIWGYCSMVCRKECNASILEVDSTSFNEKFNGQNSYIPFHGSLINKNTLEQFKECNKIDIINEAGKIVLERIKNESVLCNPSILNSFLVLSFADLKKYHYYYWFAFPVPRGLMVEKNSLCSITEEFSEAEVQFLCTEFKKLDDIQKTYFLVESIQNGIKLHCLQSQVKKINLENKKQFYFAFYNISAPYAEVGSQLKNYITMVLHYCPFLQGQVANFIALHLSRTNDFSITCHKSIIYKLKLPSLEKNYTWVGWEKNERDKMGPRLANLKNTLDPYVIAENSIDLNLKLMKWRILPDINLEKVKETKCLILGSGTLGCSVARILLAWGVRTITFVDNSTVSFSNPVRQSLFTYLDSVKMKPKALAAADNLRTIFPGVKTEGVQLAIPMPGHTIGDSLTEQTVENVNKLKVLIDTHDMIFLLMDSRESRWLPTLLANSANKIVINAALGFDTYLVMRHGIRDENNEMSGPINSLEGYKCIKGTELGCYFCNDVTAPGNTLKDRTLDQQCTVTRPGVSHIAGALAVELAISVLQHKDGARAPAFYKSSQNPPVQDLNPDNECLLGLIPHTIRGFLSSFEQILPATEKYKHCVACSDMVLKEYSENGMDFLLKVFNSSKHLEDVTKLTEMFKEIDFGDVLEFSDEDFQ
ncbi:ubiquitin-like modifier-activating enzyme ATG7 isoform X1 [Anoplophora glabripennis]|uniref:ubiquitin-like modifier-activating enzyme ATG7 isoform X1 n=1 Tax=Anoplophora glabripennis TaxID=217634 RepID=UPI000874B402|nr:ubiquitin-like modifier-activating enzyme ATG7 isoform X1 [Anoplophora glabripennis]